MKDALKEKLLAAKPNTLIPVTKEEMGRVLSGEMDDVMVEVTNKPCDCAECVIERAMAPSAELGLTAMAGEATETSPTFEDVVRPVMKYLADNYNPHTKIIIENDSAELVQGEVGFITKDYIKD